MVAGLSAGAVGYVSFAELVALPQITTTIQNDSNFADQLSRGVRITGIRLEQLAKALGALAESDLIDARCTDRYRSHYPADYIAAHHPIFALKINGERPAQWAAKTHEYVAGPYLITHANFILRDKFLTYLEQPQIPDNIMRLNFSTTAATYGPITPRGDFPPNSPVARRFLITPSRTACAATSWMMSAARNPVATGARWRRWPASSRSFFSATYTIRSRSNRMPAWRAAPPTTRRR